MKTSVFPRHHLDTDPPLSVFAHVFALQPQRAANCLRLEQFFRSLFRGFVQRLPPRFSGQQDAHRYSQTEWKECAGEPCLSGLSS